ncbi:MAG: C1 family peptidase, partial [Bacteroidetes bacterium]|nr:C1 family peptidase [Bacteroidota bacterium]
MKRIIPVIFCVMITLLSTCIFSKSLHSQTIVIDSTFTSDAIIHPFGPSDTLYSLKISGSVQLNTDTSLVRVVVGNEDSLEYMVFETYPLITLTDTFSFNNQSDETTYLIGFIPKYLKIFAKHSYMHIEYVSDSATYQENIDSLQYNAKKSNDLQKVQIMNQNILEKGLDWIAGENDLLHYYYKEKKGLFSYPDYNLQGFDYYIDGVFSFLSDEYLSDENSLFIKQFNWRYAHNAELISSPYYDPTYGWLTELKHQRNCGSCSVFGTIASLEAISNLYFNQHVNFDLSEQEVFCCTYGDCDSGVGLNPVIQYICNNPVHDDNCYIYEQLDDPCCIFCPNNPPSYSISADGYLKIYSGHLSIPDSIKSKLIRKGPLTIEILNSSMHHVMSLIGFRTGEDNTIEWIFKNSYNNFYIMELDPDEIENAYILQNPINIQSGPTYSVNYWDADNDGYYNWGIGSKPEGLIQCYDDLKKDCNDDNKTVGPYNEYFYGIDIHPEIAVYLDFLGHIYIENKGFIYFNSTDITLSFFIENQGSAKLNLNPLSAVSLECDQPCPFALYTNNLEPDICMNGGTTSFDISYSNSNGNGDLTIVKIDVLDSDNDIIDDFEFALVNFDCTKIPGILEVEENDTWDGYHVIHQDVKVLTGVTLQITGKIAMAPGAEIIVEGGAELIIDGGTITGACDEFWKGIDVWGDEEYSQYDGRQGKVKLLNGGTISHALCAVETGIEAIGYYIPTGGIVQSYGGVFKDNIIGVCFYPYQNFNPQTSEPANNLSRFK